MTCSNRRQDEERRIEHKEAEDKLYTWNMYSNDNCLHLLCRDLLIGLNVVASND
jgi:hypothetical protein